MKIAYVEKKNINIRDVWVIIMLIITKKLIYS